MVIQPAQYPALIKIIDREYTDGLDRILSAQLDDEDRIIAYAQDGNKRIRCEISDTQIRFRLLLPGESVQFAESTPDLVDTYVDRMAELDPFKPWLLQAKELLMQSADLDEYAEKLIDLYPEMPSDDFVATMRDAMTAASLGGFYSASEDSK